MSVSYFVRYEGPADQAPEFLRYYREKHTPILQRFPGIRSVVLHTPMEWRDPYPIQTGRFMLLAQMIFDSAEDLDRALQSEARTEARKDFEKFLRFEGKVYHQAAFSEDFR